MVIVAFPFFLATTTPLEFTEATFLLDEVKVIVLLAVPLGSFTFRVTFPFFFSVFLEGVTLLIFAGAFFTVTLYWITWP